MFQLEQVFMLLTQLICKNSFCRRIYTIDLRSSLFRIAFSWCFCFTNLEMCNTVSSVNIYPTTNVIFPIHKITDKIFFRQTLIFMWNRTLGEKFNFYLSGIFCLYWKKNHNSMKISWYFVISLDPKFYPKFIYIMFITNNHALFHLFWKEKILKIWLWLYLFSILTLFSIWHVCHIINVVPFIVCRTLNVLLCTGALFQPSFYNSEMEPFLVILIRALPCMLT